MNDMPWVLEQLLFVFNVWRAAVGGCLPVCLSPNAHYKTSDSLKENEEASQLLPIYSKPIIVPVVGNRRVTGHKKAK